MRTKQQVIDSSQNNNNDMGIFHWSFPLECGFMNEDYYQNYKQLSKSSRNMVKNDFVNLIVYGANNKIKLLIKNPAAFKILFTYVNPENVVPNNRRQVGDLNDFFGGFNELMDTESYEDFLNYTADSIDIYGLGFTLQYMANCFLRLNAFDDVTDYIELSNNIFIPMWNVNMIKRTTDIEELLDAYENVLLDMGVLTRLNKSFENHTVVDIAPKIPKAENSDALKPLSPELQAIAYEDPSNNPIENTSLPEQISNASSLNTVNFGSAGTGTGGKRRTNKRRTYKRRTNKRRTNKRRTKRHNT
jgi:hypothetical protein